jgi:hypothetical protein
MLESARKAPLEVPMETKRTTTFSREGSDMAIRLGADSDFVLCVCLPERRLRTLAAGTGGELRPRRETGLLREVLAVSTVTALSDRGGKVLERIVRTLPVASRGILPGAALAALFFGRPLDGVVFSLWAALAEAVLRWAERTLGERTEDAWVRGIAKVLELDPEERPGALQEIVRWGGHATFLRLTRGPADLAECGGRPDRVLILVSPYRGTWAHVQPGRIDLRFPLACEIGEGGSARFVLAALPRKER